MTTSPTSMDPFHVKIFVDETKSKINTARIAVTLADASLRLNEKDAFWYHIDALTGAVTSVANILWPSSDKPSVKRRAQFLVAELGLTGALDPAIRKTRNGYIHFDERVDEFMVATGNTNFVDRNLLPLDFNSWVAPENIARNFDHDNWTLSIFGVGASLAEAMTALDEVHTACEQWISIRDDWGKLNADE